MKTADDGADRLPGSDELYGGSNFPRATFTRLIEVTSLKSTRTVLLPLARATIILKVSKNTVPDTRRVLPFTSSCSSAVFGKNYALKISPIKAAPAGSYTRGQLCIGGFHRGANRVSPLDVTFGAAAQIFIPVH